MNAEEFYKRIKELYSPAADNFTILDVPVMRYMMIDGEGDPSGKAFNNSVQWINSLIFFLRPLVKQKEGKRFVEPPLECLYWAEDIDDFVSGNKDKWKWRVMVVVIPELLPQQTFREIIAKSEKKLGAAPQTLRLENLEEGKSVQIMHVGDYQAIQKVCDRLYNEFLPENNLKPRGYYHEIYLSDPSKGAPAKGKVVIRQPVGSC